MFQPYWYTPRTQLRTVILHLFPKYDEFGSPSCPKCDAAYGQAAKVKKIDLMPKSLNP